MAKKTLSVKVEPSLIEAISKEAEKKEWTVSYFVESIIKQYARKNKLTI